jgi:hypothetical protein
MTYPLRVFFVGGLIAYRGLFNWLRPAHYFPTMLGGPLFQILFFAYLGRYANAESDAFYAVGNAIQIYPSRWSFADYLAFLEDPARRFRTMTLPFDGGLELRAPGKNKGDAVSAILAESGPDFAAAYLGDDQTDENAFRAIKGRGLSILVRPEPRPTMADMWLRPPDELGRFLRDWLVACGAEI